jgi:1-acyl-sn-glycerol-3-phosphate acyltransferase
MVFPEGQINTDADVLLFDVTFMKLAFKHAAPVIPITIVGTERALPNAEWRWKPHAASVQVIIHKPLTPPHPPYSKEQVDLLANQVRSTIAYTWKNVEERRPDPTKVVSVAELIN